MLTRSVGVINLSWYLQNLTLTGDIPLKTYNNLKPFIIVTRYLNQPHATAQIPRHTWLVPGQCPGLTGQRQGRLLRQVTFTTSTAVPLAAILCAPGRLFTFDYL